MVGIVDEKCMMSGAESVHARILDLGHGAIAVLIRAILAALIEARGIKLIRLSPDPGAASISNLVRD